MLRYFSLVILLLTLLSRVFCPGSAAASEEGEHLQGYVPELHPTYAEEVRPSRRLVRGSDDPLTQMAAQASGVQLDFCIRLRRNMRRYVTVGPEGDWGPDDSFHTSNDVGLSEYRMYGSVNRSERDGTARSYRWCNGMIYTGCGLNESGNLVIVVFAADKRRQIEVLGKVELGPVMWSACYVLDLTGEGLIDIALTSDHGTGGLGSVDVFTIESKGILRRTASLPSAYGVLSVTDLDHNGRWELETSRFVSYDGSGSYQYNLLHSFRQRSQSWVPITDRNRHAFRIQRSFYQGFLLELKKMERKNEALFASFTFEGAQYSLKRLGFNKDDVTNLLLSWDKYSVE